MIEVVEVLFATAVSQYTVRVVGGDEVTLNAAAVVGDQIEAIDADSIQRTDELVGRCLDRTDAGPLDGLCIIRADSRDQAETIAAEEPFAKAAWRINTVRSWELSFGVLVPAARGIPTA